MVADYYVNFFDINKNILVTTEKLLHNAHVEKFTN